MINSKSRIFVAGHNGLVGSSVFKVLKENKYNDSDINLNLSKIINLINIKLLSIDEGLDRYIITKNNDKKMHY